MRQIFRSCIIAVGLTAFLFSFRWMLPECIAQHFWGADGWFMAGLVETDPLPMYYRSLFAVWMHKLIFVLLSPFGVSGWTAVSISSSLGGAIALQALWRMNPDKGFIALNVLCGSFVVLIGHVENYAWVNTFLILSFLAVQRWLYCESKAWPIFAYLALACLSHMLALFYVPAYVYLLWKNRRFDPKEVLIPLVSFTLLVSILSLFFQMLGTDIGFERLVPIGRVWSKNQFFPFLSPKHLAMLLYFHWRAAFLGIPLELPLLLLLRKRIDSLFLRFLLLCVFCGLFWTTVWHPDWGPRDWDLFSQFGVPLHVLLGLLLRPKWKTLTEKQS